MWRTRVAVCQSSYASLQDFCDGHDGVALPWAASGRERCLWRRNTDEELSSWCVGPAWCHFHFLWWSEHPAEAPSRCRSRSKFTRRRWWNDDDVPLKCFVVSWNESVIMSLKWNNVTRKIVPISRFEQYLERSAKYENWLYFTELNLDGLVASDHCCCLVVVLLLTRWIHLGNDCGTLTSEMNQFTSLYMLILPSTVGSSQDPVWTDQDPSTGRSPQQSHERHRVWRLHFCPTDNLRATTCSRKPTSQDQDQVL